MTEICPSCGQPLPRGAVACTYCGVPSLLGTAPDAGPVLNTSATYRGGLPAYTGQATYLDPHAALDLSAIPRLGGDYGQEQALELVSELPPPSGPLPSLMPLPAVLAASAVAPQQDSGQRPVALPGMDARPAPLPAVTAPASPEPIAANPSAPPALEPPDPLAEVHQFGPAPTRFFEALPYFVRVYVRRRILTEELARLVQERRQAESRVSEVHYRIGETLWVHRNDARLAPLARYFKVVSQADNHVDAKLSVSEESRKAALIELKRIEQQVEKAKAETEPLRRHDAQLMVEKAKLESQLNDLQTELRSLDQRIKRATSSSTTSPQHVQLLAAQAQRSAQEKSLHDRLTAIESELARTRGRLERAEAAVTALRATYDGEETALSRKSVRLAVATGGAREALQRALRSVSEAALRAGLLFPVQEQVANLETAMQRAQDRATAEARHRAAMGSYDVVSYELGQKLLVGGTVAAFLSLVYLVFG